MNLIRLISAFRFWRHPKYHREIIKFVRWTDQDKKRASFYSEFVKPGDLIFDVGANFGNRSKIFLALGAKVVAFEPQTYCADFLSVAYAGNPKFTLERSALSDHEGALTMFLGEAHTLSTLDEEWIKAMKDGGRFSAHQWSTRETVHVTTLDKAISIHGTPSFIKIDVEGHEFRVINGLTSSTHSLSLEFATESLNQIYKCIEHLDSLSHYEYRISLGESMEFDGPNWLTGSAIKERLEVLKIQDPLAWGDIYARLVQ